MESKINRYIIRIYALIIDLNNDILISDEYQLNMRMTKFPGGGMHFGEGTVDCLKREAIEEFGQEIVVLDHFYTTDYFQPAQFYDNAQLISVYYLAQFIEPIRFKISNKPFNFKAEKNGAQSFRWVNLNDLTEKDMTFPVDKKVVNLLKEKYCND
ncbi:MAG: NUDIX domain-containing protein [Bacteroidetes bacterium]|nr:NUDIX domain-containing protein [Bacteroidota bacterium]